MGQQLAYSLKIAGQSSSFRFNLPNDSIGNQWRVDSSIDFNFLKAFG